MKTTLEINDVLYREVVALSRMTGRTIEDLIAEGLRHVLSSPQIACALSRRLRDPVVARNLAIRGLAAVRAVELPVDAAFLAHATLSGTRDFLRGADALYAAAAEMTGGVLVSWDGEHRSRAGALSPTEWMAANP